jgi:phosphoribosylformimino-5-aminoimidazole carboxamide ribotide isomerase
MEIIPAIDIIDGKCVRLTQGDYAQKTIYHDHPLEVARQFADHGIVRLHLVDLDGAKEGKVRNWKVLEEIATQTSLVIDFGGGIKSQADVEIVFNSGAKFATIGSVAVKQEEEFSKWLSYYGPSKFLLGADVRDEKISIHGWTEQTSINIIDFIRKYKELGVNQVFCTDISKDGAMQGPAFGLYEKIISEFPDLHLIASGGVSNIEDVYALLDLGLRGAIIGKAIYEGNIQLNDLRKLVEFDGY